MVMVLRKLFFKKKKKVLVGLSMILIIKMMDEGYLCLVSDRLGVT